MRIIVLDGYTLNPGDNPWPNFGSSVELVIYDRTEASKVLERSATADILVTNKTKLSATIIAQLPRLKFIAVLATGYDVVDVGAAMERGIPVSNVPMYGTNAVAQYVMALILEFCHHIREHAQSVSGGGWAASPDWSYWKTPQIELADLTLGIVGFGRIGQRVAELGHAFGMNVLYSSRRQLPADHGFAQKVSIESLFREADIISLHCSLSPENRGFVDRQLLDKVKSSAYLINTARGQLINEKDLISCLQSGKLAGAALDVLSNEPPQIDDPILLAPNCVVTPHMAWATLPARRRIMQMTISNIKAYLSGNVINIVGLEGNK